MEQEFYIVNTNDVNFKEIVSMSTKATLSDPRCSVNKEKAIIQLGEGFYPTPILDPYLPALSHKESVSLMQQPEWQIIE